MKFLSLQPFVPSGRNFKQAQQLFFELGFRTAWDAGDYIGLERDGCKFILQNYNNTAFAENYMITVSITDAEEFWNECNKKKITEKFTVRLGEPTIQPYGKEVNLIDLAGVCWHFVESSVKSVLP
jgi:hypothetical protein